MTDYEILIIVLGMIGLPISTGVFLIALLAFLKNEKKRK